MQKLIFLAFFCLGLSFAKADTWFDPDWKEMMYLSDVIALVEYTQEGAFRAKAKPITIYKGQLKSDEIWIGGFSNRYGPIDTMKVGDRYIVFLKRSKLTKRGKQHWEERIAENPELEDYLKALEAGNSYFVWTPTSGDLKVMEDKVQYNLMTTTNYQHPYHPLEEFEYFLRAAFQNDKQLFFQETLNKVVNHSIDQQVAQYLFMLYLTGYNIFQPVFKTVADQKNPESDFALAKLMGQIKTKQSRDLLVQLLDNDNSVVQGEVVRQLANEDPKYVGPILLSHLPSSGETGMYPTNIMNPVRNSLNGGKLEIIKTFGQLKYKPAIEHLVPLLSTEDDYLFTLLVDVLVEMESKAFVPYLIQHLEKGTKTLIFEICQIITKNNLEECKKPLMEFIKAHNRNDHPSYEYAISKYMGLAHFDDLETRDFLLNDFSQLLATIDTLESSKQEDWIREYIEVFTELKEKRARPLVYQALFDWFGYNQDFADYPPLFSVKAQTEEELRETMIELLPDYPLSGVQVLVHLKNTAAIIKGQKPKYDYITWIKLDGDSLIGSKPLMDYNNPKVDTIFKYLNEVQQIISNSLDLAEDRITVSCGSFWDNMEDRFDHDIAFSPMGKFYKYAQAVPNEKDLTFLEKLKESGFTKNEYEEIELQKVILEIKGKLKR